MFLTSVERVSRSLQVLGLSLACMGTATPLAHAQEYRPDPFLPAMSPQEDKKAQDREKLKEVMRELYPEIRSMVLPDIAGAKSQIVEEAKRASLAAMREDPAFLARPSGPSAIQVSTGDGANAADTPSEGVSIDGVVKGVSNKLPEGVKFLACVDDKALYVDKASGLRFFRELPPNAPSLCRPIPAYQAAKAAPSAAVPPAPLVNAGLPGGAPGAPASRPALAPLPARAASPAPSPMPQRTSTPMPNTARPNATFQQPNAQVVPVVGGSR